MVPIQIGRPAYHLVIESHEKAQTKSFYDYFFMQQQNSSAIKIGESKAREDITKYIRLLKVLLVTRITRRKIFYWPVSYRTEVQKV
jgi:hypothetical protein